MALPMVPWDLVQLLLFAFRGLTGFSDASANTAPPLARWPTAGPVRTLPPRSCCALGAMFEGPTITLDVAQDAVIAALDGTEDAGATAGAAAGS